MSLLRGQGGSRSLWLGHEFASEDTREDVKRVVTASAAMAGLQVIMTLLALWASNFRKGTILPALNNLLFGMLLPAVGFVGATRSSSALMCCFCGSNLVLFLLQSLLLAMLTRVTLASADIMTKDDCLESCSSMRCGAVGDHCSCNLGCMNATSKICCSDFAQVCLDAFSADAAYADAVPSCWVTYRTLLGFCAVIFVCIAPVVFLTGYSSYRGSLLWQRLVAGEQLVTRGAVALSRVPVDEEADPGEGPAVE